MTKTQIVFFCIITLFLVAFTVYVPGMSGNFYYDDYRPLGGLSSVKDFESAALYVTTETSGPLGRPVSMLSFLLNIDDWDNNIEGFLLFNITLHALNSILVYFLTFQIYKKLNWSNAELASLFVATAWLVLPINISAVLITIQRMTLLSGFFSLIALNLFVRAKFFEEHQPSKAIYLQTFALVGFGLLAIFSKENAILLPVFCLLLNKTIFKKASSTYKYKDTVNFLLFLSLAVILSYLLYILFDTEGTYPNRTFNMEQRVYSQLVILSDYIELAFVPELFSYNPFHDNYAIVESPFTSLSIFIRSLFLISLFLIAIFTFKKHSVVSFSILWFFVAHLLESSIYGLELYFEHRNYLAFIGLLIGLSYGINNIRRPHLKKALISSCTVYLALLMASTFQITTIWGDKEKSAYLWFKQQTGSTRASENLALTLLNENKVFEANQVLKLQVSNCENCYASKVQLMITSCLLNDVESISKLYDAIINPSTPRFLSESAGSALAQLADLRDKGYCNLITKKQLVEMNQAFLSSELVFGEKALPFLFNLHNTFKTMDESTRAISFLEKAFSIKRDFGLAQLLIDHYLKRERYDDAKVIAESICQKTSLNPWLSKKYHFECTLINQKVNANGR